MIKSESEVMLINELRAINEFCCKRNIPFYYSFRGSKYAAYRLKSDDCKVIRLDNDYYIVSATLYLMIRRYLVALRKGDGSAETLFHL
jgi:hypothetical protein